MRKLCIGYMLILFAFSPVILTAQDTQSSTGIKTICETFLKMIQAGDYNKAFSYIQSKPTSIPEQEFSEIEITTIQQSKTIHQLYGEARRAVLVSEKTVSGVALRLEYLVIRENIPIRWKFIYYKADGDWKLVSIEFDDKLEEVF